MQYSVWYEADSRGYRIIAKQGIRVCGKESFDNTDGLNEVYVRMLAKKKAREIAAELQTHVLGGYVVEVVVCD